MRFWSKTQLYVYYTAVERKILYNPLCEPVDAVAPGRVELRPEYFAARHG